MKIKPHEHSEYVYIVAANINVVTFKDTSAGQDQPMVHNDNRAPLLLRGNLIPPSHILLLTVRVQQTSPTTAPGPGPEYVLQWTQI